MSGQTGAMRLGAFLMATGHHVAAWRHPDAAADGGVSVRHYAAVGRPSAPSST